MLTLQAAPFFEACTQHNLVRVVASPLVCGSGYYLAAGWMRVDSITGKNELLVLATVRNTTERRSFATLDSAYAFARRAVPGNADMILQFSVC